MSVFFYRPWTGSNSLPILTPQESIYYTRWGYSALLGITLAAGLIANITYLLGYIICPPAMFQVPHIAIVGLCMRDILVCLVVFPAALDWLTAGIFDFNGGSAWCGVAVFFDFYLNALYPLLLISLAIILYTRKLPPPLPPSREPSLRIASSRMSHRSGYTHKTGYTNRTGYTSRTQQSHPNKSIHSSSGPQSPSITVTKPDQNQSADFRRGFSKSRNGSMAGSEYGGSAVGRRNQFTTQMRSVDEEYGGRAVSPVASDLWESASLDYPGREEGLVNDFEAVDDYDDEPRLREWLRYLVPLSYLLALGFGVPAAINIETEMRPQCYVRVLPFDNPTSYINNDPGMNLMLCSVILTYLAPAVVLLFLCLLLCTTRWTKDGKLNRFYKMCIALSLFFVGVKSPVDIIQFRNLIEALRGATLINPLANDLEYEILLVWSSLVPVIANPIIYFTCVSDYRANIGASWKYCTKKQNVESEYFAEQEKETRESDVL